MSPHKQTCRLTPILAKKTISGRKLANELPICKHKNPFPPSALARAAALILMITRRHQATLEPAPVKFAPIKHRRDFRTFNRPKNCLTKRDRFR